MHRYSVSGHGRMIADAARTDAYVLALERSVRPGDAVLDLGTGTGLFAMVACRAGARHVYAVEADDIIEIARANAAANGLARSITFFHAMSTQVTLPERVDVIVSDLRGVLPHFEQHVHSIADARERFLAPGGRLIPSRDRVMVACVRSPEEYERIRSPWDERPYGVDLAAGRELEVNTWRKVDFASDQVVSQAHCCAVLDYARLAEPTFAAGATLQVTRAGEAHGLAAWFESELAEGIGFSCSPLATPRARIYSQAFFPWPRPATLSQGDRIEVAIDARLIGGDYVWSWRTRLPGAEFRQSSFFSEPLSPAKLGLRDADHVPRVGEDARVDRAILESMERGQALGEIARAIAAEHPERFPRWEDALARVGELSERYAR